MSQPTNSNTHPNQAENEVVWWLKYSAKGLGTFSGFVALGFGLWRVITFTPLCLVAGILQMIFGILLLVLEAPCCCLYFDFVEAISKFADSRPFWQKAALYVGISILPMLLCGSISTVIGSGLIFLTGSVYGLMALGKKATREEMMEKASRSDSRTSLVNNEVRSLPV